jgi:hypothetical protein
MALEITSSADQQAGRCAGGGRGRGAGTVISDGETAPARHAKPHWRSRLSAACSAAAQIDPSALVLYDVTTLWFDTDTDTGDGFREPGFSKEHRVDPRITVGLLEAQVQDRLKPN